MKTYTTIVALVIMALLTPTQVLGHASMLEDQETGKSSGLRRKLGWYSQTPEERQAKYRSIYYRCCGNPTDSSGTALDCNDEANENACRSGVNVSDDSWRVDGGDSNNYPGNCKCPVRGSSKVSWGWWSNSKSYYTKWQDSCGPDGSITKKAGINQ